MTNITTYTTALEAEKATLTTELATFAVHHADTDDWELRLDAADSNSADDNDQGDASETATEHAATLALLETRYRDVVRALQKIAADTYGHCELCEQAIEVERLSANPAARTCIAHRDAEGTLPL